MTKLLNWEGEINPSPLHLVFSSFFLHMKKAVRCWIRLRSVGERCVYCVLDREHTLLFFSSTDAGQIFFPVGVLWRSITRLMCSSVLFSPRSFVWLITLGLLLPVRNVRNVAVHSSSLSHFFLFLNSLLHFWPSEDINMFLFWCCINASSPLLAADQSAGFPVLLKQLNFQRKPALVR